MSKGHTIEADAGQFEFGGFRAQRVGLAGQFLDQEIEPPSGRFGLCQQRAQFACVRGQALQLLLNVGAGGGERGLLRQPQRIERDLRRHGPLAAGSLEPAQ